MKLPSSITREIIDYLHVEFGESAEDPDALKVSDLKYEGRHVIDGVPTHFWSYPAGADKHWATVQELDDSYCLGTSTNGPRGETVDKARALRTLRVEFRAFSESAKAMRPIKMNLKDGAATIPVRFPSGGTMEIDVEVSDEGETPDVSIAISLGEERGCFVRCASGVVLSYDTEFGYECLVSVGTGPWEGND